MAPKKKTKAKKAARRATAAAVKPKARAKRAAPRRAAKRAVATRVAPRRPTAKRAAPRRVAPKRAIAKPTAPKRAIARAAAPKRAPVKATPAKKAPAVRRRDGAGHLDPQYAATLRAKSREGQTQDRDVAFLGRSRTRDDLAEEMGESWVETATSGEDESQDVYNQNVPEERGGPFVTSTAGQEFAEGTDPSNPSSAKREPFPTT